MAKESFDTTGVSVDVSSMQHWYTLCITIACCQIDRVCFRFASSFCSIAVIVTVIFIYTYLHCVHIVF